MRLAPGIILFSALSITAVCSAEEVDLSVVSRIKDQAFNHSQVMDYMHYLADAALRAPGLKNLETSGATGCGRASRCK